MVRPKLPLARMVSQWNSSSLSCPSGWLWQLVMGASANRFSMDNPHGKCIGAARLLLEFVDDMAHSLAYMVT